MNNRVLVIDDDQQVLDTYQEILAPKADEIDELVNQIGLSDDEEEPLGTLFDFELERATQGREGVALAEAAIQRGAPFAVALIDMRMPPGMDGLETARALRALDDRIQIVIVTAYTDRSIEEIQQVLNHDAILVYKPFTREEIFQMARTLCISWNDRVEKLEAFAEIERLASYPQENPSPILRFSDQGALLYANPYSADVMAMMEVAELGDTLKGAWLKRIHRVFEDQRMLEIEVAGEQAFYQLSFAPINDRGYVNLYAQDITRRYLLNRQLTYQARHDALTGLMNRREFLRKLNLLLRRVDDRGGEHALLYLDLNGFKEVNDAAGHLAGDQVLRELSSALLNEVKDGDALSRIGGDEFGMLVYNVTPEQARIVAERISEGVLRQRFSWKGHEFTLGVSVGVAMLNQQNIADADAVLNRADQACYAAKGLPEEQGRVYIHHLDRPVSEQEHEALRIAHEVREAIDNDAFRLYLQPITVASIENSSASFYEVLLRMESNNGEVVSPAEFIPSSERFDLMPVLDRWVIEQTIAKIAARGAAEPQGRYSINLSGMTLAGEGISLYIRDQLERYQVDPKWLQFEISETVAFKQMTMVQHFIKEMRVLGVHIAIDDYGAIASSFTSLQKLPADLIKIDGRLVRGVIHNPVERAVVESILRVSSVLGMECVAVSVENKETITSLQQMGMHYLQGYEMGKPAAWE